MKLPENYQDLTYILLLHLQAEPSPHKNESLRSQLSESIKIDEFGELMAYALKQNLIYVNYTNGATAYKLTSKAQKFIQVNASSSNA